MGGIERRLLRSELLFLPSSRSPTRGHGARAGPAAAADARPGRGPAGLAPRRPRRRGAGPPARRELRGARRLPGAPHVARGIAAAGLVPHHGGAVRAAPSRALVSRRVPGVARPPGRAAASSAAASWHGHAQPPRRPTGGDAAARAASSRRGRGGHLRCRAQQGVAKRRKPTLLACFFCVGALACLS